MLCTLMLYRREVTNMNKMNHSLHINTDFFIEVQVKPILGVGK